MNKTDRENRIVELELELSTLKSDLIANKQVSKQISENSFKEKDYNILKRALSESEERFQTLFNHAPLGYQSLDINGNLIDVNQKWEEILGYTRDEVIGKWFGDFISFDYKEGFRKRFQIFKAEGKIHSEFEMIHKNGNKLFIAFDGQIGCNLNGEFKQTHCILQDKTIEKKTEELLRKKDEILKFYMDNSPMAVIECDSDFVITQWTGESEKIFGWTSEEVVGKNITNLNIICEADIPNVEKKRKVIRSGVSNQVCYSSRCIRKDGSNITCEWYNIVLKDENGKMQSVLSEVVDNTKRKQVENELKKSKDYFRLIFENSASAICIIEPDSTISMVNSEYCRLMGYLNEEVVGKSWTQLVSSIEFERLKKDFLKKMRDSNYENDKFEFVIYRKNGELMHVLMTLAILSNDKMIASFVDITEVTKSQAVVAESSQFNKQIINNVDDGIIVFDKDLHYKVWNPFMENLTGIPASFIIGKHVTEVSSILEEIRITENFKSALEGHHSDSFNFQFHFSDSGKSGWASSKSNPMRDVFGEIIGVIVTIYEITDLKLTESELIKSKEKAEESDRLKTAFLTNMSHEIRTPMNGILGFAELLKEPTLTLEEQQEFIKTIGISGERMLSTINSIVDISKIEAGMVNVDINETNINDKMLFTYKFFKPEVESKGLKFLFKNSLPANEAIIKTDNEKVYGILTNLVKNAIKFTHKGLIEFGYEKKGEYLEFYVKDTGIGIPKNQKGLIFERFRQGSESHNRGYEGSGLGLSICKSYVEMLGGRIWVESEEGLGSTFYFTIPYNLVSEEITTVKDVVSEELKDIQTKKLKILIVEDDEISYSLLSRVVQKISKEVVHAITGVEAVEACRNYPDFDLVLMDIRLPQMNGLEATRQIRQFNKDIIIIAQTAYGFSSDCEKALIAGCNDYITKPINKTLLYELIKKHINK